MNRREFCTLPLTAAAATPASGAVESAYSVQDGSWNIDWPERLSQHDVVYLSPPEDPVLGLPLGNGDVGALVWTTERELIIAINKNDVWDDAKPGAFRNWGASEEGYRTSQRHCGRLVIDFGSPVFDLLYQKNFEARLEMATATATLHAETPFAEARVSSLVSVSHKVLAVRCEWKSADQSIVRASLERWGSRTFAHWYSQVNRDPSVGLDGTASSIERGRIVIRQRLRTMEFAVAAALVPDAPAQPPTRAGSRAGEWRLEGAPGFTLLVAVATSEDVADPVAETHRVLDSAERAGYANIRAEHEAEWKRFWSRSMIDLPEKYLENIWHLTLYFANSSSRGKYPPHFCNGLWGWNRDFVPWNYYFHWNMQDYVWPLHTANHAELAVPYLRYRREQLDKVVADARDRLKKPGAFYSDVSDRHGYNDATQDGMRTAGPQIALDFWRHYAYTGDEKFLRDSAWPVIRETTRFLASGLEKGADGRYHPNPAHAYEGSPRFSDVITELSMVRGLFPISIATGQRMGHDNLEIERWRELLEKLVGFHLVDLEEFEYERRGEELFHKGGLAAGKKLASQKVFSVGRDKQGAWVRDRYAVHPEKAYYGIPDPELSVVFPSDFLGLGQRDTELFRAAVTQVRLHPPTVPEDTPAKPATMAGSGDLCMGWCPYPIVLARLGLSDELAAELANSVSTWQLYPQGFGHYGPYHVFKPEFEQRWRVNAKVNDAASTTKPRATFPFPTWPFRHFDNEAMPIVSAAINEMLLQSHDGVIRVAPAVPEAWTVRFKLAARGGFLVSAERVEGRVRWISIESQHGTTCKVEHPWPQDALVCLDARGRRVETKMSSGNAVEFPTRAGARYLLVRDEKEFAAWRAARISPKRQTGPRRLKKAILGRERLF
jgi:alpha-L-fucosidase 2